MSIGLILSKQNSDGGWPYVRGKSWTEPTAYAIMASLDAGEHEAAARGFQWLIKTERDDGGWAPQAAVDESTWVTGLVGLLPPESLGSTVYERAIRWLTTTSGQDTTAIYRLRQWLLGNTPSDPQLTGWPWVPGTAAWVGPTSIAILALEKADRRASSAVVRKRLGEGRQFLLSRTCQEGGWNHGSARTLGYDSHPYPETTGMALAALRGTRSEKLERALQMAQGFLLASRSADAQNWLQLGLRAHNRLPSGYLAPPDLGCRTVAEASLRLLVIAAERGAFPF